MTRSTWSGGVTWSGTAKWMPDGATASGPLVPQVAIAGTLRTTVMAASWRLGPTDFLSDLSPGTATMTFAGYFAVAPGDSIVISATPGVLWVGRVDTCSTTWDEASNAWTTVTGTDPLGALGEASVIDYTPADAPLDTMMEDIATVAGVSLDVVDGSSGLPTLDWNDPEGSVLDLLNRAARSSNAMLGLQRDGSILAIMREAVTPSDQVVITDRYSEWVEAISIAVDINRWLYFAPAGGGTAFEVGIDEADIAIYGERTYTVDPDIATFGFSHIADWIAYGGSQRPTITVTLPLTGWADDDLMLLNPFDWVTESSNDWQVMSVAHDVTPEAWTVTLTADNLLALL